MESDSDIAKIKQIETSYIDNNTIPICGQWYWVEKGDDDRWLGCVEKVGTNYVKLRSATLDRSSRTVRIHLDNFEDFTSPEPSPKDVIDERVEYYQNKANNALVKIRAITQRLGLSKQHALELSKRNAGSNQLAVISSNQNIKEHENHLVKAKNKDLPKLFDEVKYSTKMVADWMKFESLSLEVMAKQMQEDISDIDGRIFNVKIYGGIDEHVHVICEGEHASIDEKIHVFQNKKYMDEECLASYKTGGMEFQDVGEFSNWLLSDENLDRIFPYPKSVVPFQIRRHPKLRKCLNIIQAFENFSKEQIDKTTYFFIRNGDAVYCVDSLMEFPEKVFPAKDEFDPSQPIYFTVGSFKEIKWMYESEYMDRVEEQKRIEKLSDQWVKNNPDVSWIHNPHRTHSSFDYKKWELLNDESLYFDDFNDHLASIIKSYNRISLLLQGLLDRSNTLHPHVNIKTWESQSFINHIKLVYDHDNVLYEGNKPDIEQYIKECNKSIRKGSVVYGQYDYWRQHELDKENRRRDRSWRHQDEAELEYFCAPYGDPGPGKISAIAHMVKSLTQAKFVWFRERRGYRGWDNGPVKATLTVPIEKLFNIDAYKPGDYKLFFKDPRTRAEYIYWAPMLLMAEDYHAGLVVVKKPYCKDTDQN